MDYFSTSKIRKSLLNTTKDPKLKKKISDFYSDSNIFNVLNVNKVYIPKGTDEIHISEDDFEKINLLAKLKLDRFYKTKRVGKANPEIYKEMVEFKVSSIGDVKREVALKMKEDGGVRLTTKIAVAKAALKQKLIKELPDDLNEKRIVSIDFEFSNKKDLITEMGMTIKQGDDMISKHYLIESAYQIKSDGALQRRFRQGKTEIISLDTMTDIIKKQLALADYALFHDHGEDMRLFNVHGIWINEYQKLNILDTQVLHGKQRPLQELLETYEIEHKKTEMHNSGNDAYYTMKLLDKLNINNNLELAVDINLTAEKKTKMIIKP